MSPAEQAACRQDVADVRALARRAANRIEANTRRPLAEGFAVEALRGLADAAEALILAPPQQSEDRGR